MSVGLVNEGLDLVATLHAALINSQQWERDAYLRALLQEEPVLALPDLTQREKETLIALRLRWGLLPISAQPHPCQG